MLSCHHYLFHLLLHGQRGIYPMDGEATALHATCVECTLYLLRTFRSTFGRFVPLGQRTFNLQPSYSAAGSAAMR